MSQQSLAAADGGPSPQRTLTAWSGEWLALWVGTVTQFAILLWLYLPSLGFRPTTLQDQDRLSAVARLPLFEALGYVTRGPLRPGDNWFFWMMAHGGHPMLWRAVLLVIFLLTTAFVQYYATKHGGSWLAGLASASCFAFSPTSASVVCWLSGAHIGMCALSLMIYVELGERVLDRASSHRRSVGCLLGALVALVVALSFYELAVLAPLLLAMYHGWVAPNARGRSVRVLYLGSLLCVAAYVALQIGAAGALHWWSGESPWLLIANALRYNVQNFWLWLWPWGTFGVLVPDTLVGHATENLACWLVGLVVYGAIWLLRRRDPKSTYGFFWCALFLFGGGALLHFQGTPIAQHHLYLPMLGFTFAGARVTLWVLARVVASIPRKSLRLVVDGLISVAFFWTFVPLVAAASSTVELWGDEEQLYLTTLENYPGSAEVLGRLTRNYLATERRVAEPAREPDPLDGLLDSLLMRPIHESPTVLIKKGRELLERARYVEAGSAFARALEAGARGEEHFEAGKTLVYALLHTDQRASAAALLERLRREYPQRAELRAVEL